MESQGTVAGGRAAQRAEARAIHEAEAKKGKKVGGAAPRKAAAKKAAPKK